MPPTYEIPAGTLHAGQQHITVRIQNTRNEGGFVGTPESMYIDAGDTKMPLAGHVEVPSRAADQCRRALCQTR